MKISCFGDSNTRSIATRPGYPAFLQQHLGPDHDVINNGVSGETADGGVARVITDVGPHVPAFCVVQFGINDINAGTASADIITDLTTIYNTLLVIQVEPIPVQIFPFGNYSGWSSAKETKRGEVNDFIATQESYVSVDLLADGNALKAAYDNGDGLHLSAVGAYVFGRHVRGLVDTDSFVKGT